MDEFKLSEMHDLYAKNVDVDIGDYSEDTTADSLLETYNDVDIVSSSGRRGLRPTIAGTRLEVHIISEQVFHYTINFMSATIGHFSEENAEELLELYENPERIPSIQPSSLRWFEDNGLVDYFDPDLYYSVVNRCYRYATMEVASRYSHVFPHFIDAMVRYYDDHPEEMAYIRRSKFDSRHCMTFSSKLIDKDPEKELISDVFVATDGSEYNSYEDFLAQNSFETWPPENPIYIDHKETFGVDRP